MLTLFSYRIGVAIQLVCFGLFTVIAIRFNFIARRFDSQFESRISNANEKYITIDGEERKLKKNWPVLLHVTNIACACILVRTVVSVLPLFRTASNMSKIRSIYRMVDFSLGRTGYTESHEWCIYIFDALPIFPVVVMYIWWHPGKYLPYLGLRLPKHAR